MSVPSFLVDALGRLLHTETVGNHTHLVIEQHAKVATQFKAVTHSTATTTAVVTPRSGGAMVITDIIISGEKHQGAGQGTITILFTDDTNTVSIIVADNTDAPVNLPVAFAGRWKGWVDARIDFTTNQANDVTVSVGYYFLQGDDHGPTRAGRNHGCGSSS